MHERYEYRTFRIPRGGWRAIAESLSVEGVLGMWRAEIGAAANEGALLTTVGTRLPGLTVDIDEVVELEATARPTAPRVIDDAPGVYAHRWFEVGVDDLGEFESLSTYAWPEFEATVPGIEVLGLFKAVARTDTVRLLLITRYPDLGAWEKSRTGAGGASDRPFQRRAEITRWSIVRTYRVVPRT